MTENNVFLYWVGHEYKLIKILRNIIYLHSTNGVGYKVNLITQSNINEYIEELPEYFNELCPANQADYIRVIVICKFGGIWLDSDTLVMESLDSLFKLVNDKNGFFIKENNTILWNGVFGSKKNTPLMLEWKQRMLNILEKNVKIHWTEIGNSLLQSIYNQNSDFYDGYEIFNGCDNMYPVNWNLCVNEFLDKPYENYKKIIREYQPLVVLVNSVYKKIEDKKIEEILNRKTPLQFFLEKSYQNMQHLVDLDFIEIGTSNFDTLIQNSTNEKGISVEAVKYYIDKLPDKPNIKKLNVAISNVNSFIDVYYIPESVIEQNQLQNWFKGCNKIGDYHPLHIKHNLQEYVLCEKIKVITCFELFYSNNIKKVKYLKIDTEGHDVVILDSLFDYIKFLPKDFYPNKILFESNEHTPKNLIDDIIYKYTSIGYKLIKRGYDTVIEYVI